MSDIAIRVENVSKLYRIGSRQARYKTIRESLTDAFTSPFRRLRLTGDGRRKTDASSFVHDPRSPVPSLPSPVSAPRSPVSRPPSDDYIWALEDVSFEVKQGEVIGIIGRNGAGKSTLLKILSRITKPTRGRAEIHGRVGSLLEVGTGFHPELTGRENIYLNGAIIGMRAAEIDRKFDEMVAFAEIEKFIDTPVKHYSSGMYVRLAFAVAAHLEPEILLIDEVLAVGDIAFQKKCLGRMEDVSRAGRTVFFVSHNMAAVRKLCHAAVLLSEGRILTQGPVDEVVSRYEVPFLDDSACDLPAGVLYQAAEGQAGAAFTISRVEVRDARGMPKPYLSTWDPVSFRIYYHAAEPVAEGSAVLWLLSREGVPLLLCSTQPDSNVSMPISRGPGSVECLFPRWPFAAGQYFVDVALAIPMKEYLCRLPEPVPLRVQPRDVFSSGRVMPETRRALVAIPHQWRFG